MPGPQLGDGFQPLKDPRASLLWRLVSEPIRWPYECRYCGTEMKYLRLPNVVLRRRESKRPPGSDKSKAAGKK